MSSTLSDRLGSLSQDHGKLEGKKETEDKQEDMIEPPEPQGSLVQRCVVLHRDEKGYGLTVSGDNPVFVQSVKDNGAAFKAGVKKGDRIIKVNGTLVTNSNHVEVVNLIRSAGTYVALTLLGRQQGGGPSGKDPQPGGQMSPTSPVALDRAGSDRITGPQPVDAKQDQEYKTQKIATIRMMYEKASNDYEKMKNELQRNPNAGHLQVQLSDIGKMLRTLEQQLLDLTGIPAESQSHYGQRSPPPIGLPPLPPSAPGQHASPGHATLPPPHPGGSHPPGGGGGTHLALERRYGSRENLSHSVERELELPTELIQQAHNPAPWLPGGPRHRKADSMPEYVYPQDDPIMLPEATVMRSHSDSRKRSQITFVPELREGTSSDQIEKLRDDISVRRRNTMKKTSSLPTSMYEAGVSCDQSPHHSPATSPTPGGQMFSEEWTEREHHPESAAEEVSPMEVSIMTETSPMATSLTPSPDQRQMFQVHSPGQVNVIAIEDEEFSTDDEHRSPSRASGGVSIETDGQTNSSHVDSVVKDPDKSSQFVLVHDDDDLSRKGEECGGGAAGSGPATKEYSETADRQRSRSPSQGHHVQCEEHVTEVQEEQEGVPEKKSISPEGSVSVDVSRTVEQEADDSRRSSKTGDSEDDPREQEESSAPGDASGTDDASDSDGDDNNASEKSPPDGDCENCDVVVPRDRESKESEGEINLSDGDTDSDSEERGSSSSSCSSETGSDNSVGDDVTSEAHVESDISTSDADGKVLDGDATGAGPQVCDSVDREEKEEEDFIGEADGGHQKVLKDDRENLGDEVGVKVLGGQDAAVPNREGSGQQEDTNDEVVFGLPVTDIDSVMEEETSESLVSVKHSVDEAKDVTTTPGHPPDGAVDAMDDLAKDQLQEDKTEEDIQRKGQSQDDEAVDITSPCDDSSMDQPLEDKGEEDVQRKVQSQDDEAMDIMSPDDSSKDQPVKDKAEEDVQCKGQSQDDEAVDITYPGDSSKDQPLDVCDEISNPDSTGQSLSVSELLYDDADMSEGSVESSGDDDSVEEGKSQLSVESRVELPTCSVSSIDEEEYVHIEMPKRDGRESDIETQDGSPLATGDSYPSGRLHAERNELVCAENMQDVEIFEGEFNALFCMEDEMKDVVIEMSSLRVDKLDEEVVEGEMNHECGEGIDDILVTGPSVVESCSDSGEEEGDDKEDSFTKRVQDNAPERRGCETDVNKKKGEERKNTKPDHPSDGNSMLLEELKSKGSPVETIEDEGSVDSDQEEWVVNPDSHHSYDNDFVPVEDDLTEEREGNYQELAGGEHPAGVPLVIQAAVVKECLEENLMRVEQDDSTPEAVGKGTGHQGSPDVPTGQEMLVAEETRLSTVTQRDEFSPGLLEESPEPEPELEVKSLEPVTVVERQLSGGPSVDGHSSALERIEESHEPEGEMEQKSLGKTTAGFESKDEKVYWVHLHTSLGMIRESPELGGNEEECELKHFPEVSAAQRLKDEKDRLVISPCKLLDADSSVDAVECSTQPIIVVEHFLHVGDDNFEGNSGNNSPVKEVPVIEKFTARSSESTEYDHEEDAESLSVEAEVFTSAPTEQADVVFSRKFSYRMRKTSREEAPVKPSIVPKSREYAQQYAAHAKIVKKKSDEGNAEKFQRRPATFHGQTVAEMRAYADENGPPLPAAQLDSYQYSLDTPPSSPSPTQRSSFRSPHLYGSSESLPSRFPSSPEGPRLPHPSLDSSLDSPSYSPHVSHLKQSKSLRSKSLRKSKDKHFPSILSGIIHGRSTSTGAENVDLTKVAKLGSDYDTSQGSPRRHSMPCIRPVLLPPSPSAMTLPGFCRIYDNKLEEHGPFSDLNKLKHKYAHTAVFLHYLILNSDPAPLFFYLVTESYTQGNMKEMRRWAYEIHSTFLVEKAPLRINVDDDVVANIDNILQLKHDKEDSMKGVFLLARHMAQNEIKELLQDYRQKRALGLGSLYGDHELLDENMDRPTELHIIEKYLVPHFEHLMENEETSDRNQAMASALATFLKQVGLQLSSKSNQSLERCQSFVARDRKIWRLTKSTKKMHHAKNHQFAAQHYYTVTLCTFCQGVMWGIGNQGYQCLNCDINIHKQCMDRVREPCVMSKKKKDPHRKSILEKITTRKPSANNPSLIKEATDAYEANRASAPAALQRPSSMREEDEDEVTEALAKHEERERERSVGHIATIRPFRTGAAGRQRERLRNSTFYEPPHVEELRDAGDPDSTDVSRPNRLSVLDRLESYPDDNAHNVTPPRSHSPDHNAENTEKKKTISLNRSESLNRTTQQKSRSKNVRRTRSDVLMDEHTLKALNHSGSSSNSSIPGSFDNTYNHDPFTDSFHSTSSSSHRTLSGNAYTPSHDDSDFEVEVALPSLEEVLPKDVLKRLKPKEKKRQDVINELFYTERNHVRNLKIIDQIFHQPMRVQENISDEFLRLLFSNIRQMIDMHSELNSSFKECQKEAKTNKSSVGDIATILLKRFEGEAGSEFKEACAKFCRNQSHALDQLRIKQRKDQKLALFLQEASCNPLCRRLSLKDLLPTGMQRLTKYPLLIENLMKYTSNNSEEYKQLEKALEHSKDHLNVVNEAVKDCENQQKLIDIQKRLDQRPVLNSDHPIIKEYKNLDLTKYKMIHDGPLTWRINRSKQIELHVLLLEDVLVLLQKQDERLVLKCQSMQVAPGKEDTKVAHVPIIKLAKLLPRQVATDKRAFFLVSISDMGPQIYELVAMSVEDKKRWFKYITEAADTYKAKDKDNGRHLRRNATTPGRTTSGAGDGHRSENDEVEEGRKESREERDTSLVTSLDRNRSSSVNSLDHTESLETAEVPSSQMELIQPTELVISTPSIERAECVLSPHELLKQKDELIQQTVSEKQKLIGEILHIPPDHFDHIAEMAGELEGEKDARELVLGALHHSMQFTTLFSQGLNPSDVTFDPAGHMTPDSRLSSPAADPMKESTDSIQESDETESPSEAEGAASSSRVEPAPSVNVSLPTQKLQTISRCLSDNLRQLLRVITERDEEHERLLQELTATKERLESLQSSQEPSPSSSATNASRPSSFISVASSTSDLGDPGHDLQLDLPKDDNAVLSASPLPSDPTTPTASPAIVLIESRDREVQVEHFVAMDPVHSDDGSADPDTDDTETEDGFVDAQTHSDAVPTDVTEVIRLDKENENVDTISCDTTSTDSTGSTVIGVSF